MRPRSVCKENKPQKMKKKKTLKISRELTMRRCSGRFVINAT